MSKYTKGKIYKIIQLDDDENMYIGSTIQSLSGRMCLHRSTSRIPDRKNIKFYKHVSENGGWSNFHIVLIEPYPCDNKDELNAREEYWRKMLNGNLNSYSAYGLDKEKKKRYHYEYNKLPHMKKYNREYNKQPHMKKYHRDYDKNRVSTKIKCDCGGKTDLLNISKHVKTQIHQNWLYQWLIDCENYAIEYGYI